MKKFAFLTAAAFALACASNAEAATVIDVNGSTNASLDGTNAVTTSLAAGKYTFTFVNGAYTAFSRFAGSGGCDAAGSNCVTGFENSIRYSVNGVTYTLGDGAASGGLGPVSGGGYYDTAATAFANSSKYSASLLLSAPATVDFFLYDDALGDNRGGVSIGVSAVPEPATWAMMITGFALVGFGLRSCRKTAGRALYA